MSRGFDFEEPDKLEQKAQGEVTQDAAEHSEVTKSGAADIGESQLAYALMSEKTELEKAEGHETTLGQGATVAEEKDEGPVQDFSKVVSVHDICYVTDTPTWRVVEQSPTLDLWAELEGRLLATGRLCGQMIAVLTDDEIEAMQHQIYNFDKIEERFATLDDVCHVQVRAAVTTHAPCGQPSADNTVDEEYFFKLGAIKMANLMPLIETPDGLFEDNKPTLIAGILPDLSDRVPREFVGLHRAEDFLKKLAEPTLPREDERQAREVLLSCLRPECGIT